MSRISPFSTVRGYLRFCGGLPGFLRTPMTLAGAERTVARRQAERGESLLALVNRAVSAGPYVALFDAAGPDRQAVRRWVRRDGPDRALERLRDAGVYLTYDEFCGRAVAERHGRALRFSPADFENPSVRAGCTVATGATHSTGTRTKFDLDLLTNWAAHYALMLAEHGVERAAHAAWFIGLPGGAGVSTVLAAAKVGRPIDRWFAPDQPRGVGSLLGRAATPAVCGLGRAVGARIPFPTTASSARADRVARWADRHRPAVIHTYAGAALAVVRAARHAGHDLAGTCFFVTGEPLTPAKIGAIEAAGARAVPMYGFTEAGFLGCGCARSNGTDRVHLFTDAFAAVEGIDGDGTGSVLFTTLRPYTPKVLINVSIGDRGTLGRAACDCRFDRLGLHRTLEAVHSTHRLTVLGMTYEQSRVVPIIETVLPRDFGGGPGDYQLVERERADGRSELVLRVAPRVGPIDADALRRRFIEALSDAPTGHRVMVDLWRQAGAIRVRRAPPLSTARGKIPPVRTLRAQYP